MPSWRVISRIPAVAALFMACFGTWGCSSSGIDTLRIPAHDYERAFSLAARIVREHGLDPSLRDIRRGIIETDPALAPSLLVPWKQDSGTARDRFENTINQQRRRARILFLPAGNDDMQALHPAGQGTDLLAHDLPTVRLQDQGEVDVHMVVSLERRNRRGQSRSTWSRRSSSRTSILDVGQPVRSVVWSTVARDREFERLLLAELQSALLEDRYDLPPLEPPGQQ